MKRLFSLLTAFVFLFSSVFTPAVYAADKYTVSGFVTNNELLGIGDTEIRISGDIELSQTTDTTGYYRFNDIERGSNFEISAYKDGYLISPTAFQVSDLRSDRAINFKAERDKVTKVNRSNDNVNTIPLPVKGVVSVQPEYVKETKSFFSEKASEPEPVKTGQKTYTISGRVNYYASGLVGVRVMVNNDRNLSATTDVNGYYTIRNVRSNIDVLLSFSRDGFGFNPEETFISSRDSDITINVNAYAKEYKVSGLVSEDKRGIGSVDIKVTNGIEEFSTETDDSGYYEVKGLKYGDNITIIASKYGVIITPLRLVINKIDSDRTVNFSAVVSKFIVSGKVVDIDGVPVKSAEVELVSSFETVKTFTNSKGKYSFENVPSSLSYLIKASKENHDEMEPKRVEFLEADTVVDLVISPTELTGKGSEKATAKRNKRKIQREKEDQKKAEKQRLEAAKLAQKEQKEREAAEKKAKAEAAKLEKIKQKEREAAEKKEKARVARIEREEEKERIAAEKRAKAETARLEREEREEERKRERAEAARLEREQREREEAEKRERLEAARIERIEREREEAEKREKLEAARLERIEKEREEAEKRERLEAARLEREQKEREEAEKRERLEAARLEREQKEREEAEKRERLEAERREAAEAARLEREQKEREAAEEKERLEAERREAAEVARLEREQREREEADKKEIKTRKRQSVSSRKSRTKQAEKQKEYRSEYIQETAKEKEVITEDFSEQSSQKEEVKRVDTAKSVDKSKTIRIRGVVGTKSNQIKDVKLTLEPGGYSTFTDEKGRYSFDNIPLNSRYILTPVLDKVNFSPEVADFEDISSNINQDFTPHISVEGEVFAEGSMLEDVIIYINDQEAARTNNFGKFKVDNIEYLSNINISAVKPGYSLYPGKMNIKADRNYESLKFIVAFSVSGRVTVQGSGHGLGGVEFYIDGKDEPVIGDFGGNYIISGLASGGNFIITPKYGGFKFIPESKEYASINKNFVAQNFEAVKESYNVKGNVSVGGKPIKNALVSITRRSLKYFTDEEGNFEIKNLDYGGPYTVTVESREYNFEPIVIELLESNIEIEFSNDISLGGTVLSGGKPLANITVDVNGRKNKTDENGRYLVTGLRYNGDYLLTLSGQGLMFDPFQKEYKSIKKSILDEEFEASIIISGRITFEGKPLDKAFVTVSGRTEKYYTDINGYYTIQDAKAGNDYIVEPSCPGYTFDPPQRDYRKIQAGKMSENFKAIISGHTVKGTVLAEGRPLKGVAVIIEGTTKSQTVTDMDGEFSFRGLAPNKKYMLTVQSKKYNFESPSGIINNLEGDTVINLEYGKVAIPGSGE